ncbi:uncharacterized protein METZ01_LOCUS474673, partial [marine metagenome]
MRVSKEAVEHVLGNLNHLGVLAAEIVRPIGAATGSLAAIFDGLRLLCEIEGFKVGTCTPKSCAYFLPFTTWSSTRPRTSSNPLR